MGWVCRGPRHLGPQTPCPCGPGQHSAPLAPRCREAGSRGFQRQRESLVGQGSSGPLLALTSLREGSGLSGVPPRGPHPCDLIASQRLHL